MPCSSSTSLLIIRESCSFKDGTEQSTDSFTEREGQSTSVLLHPGEGSLFSAPCLKSHMAALEQHALTYCEFTPAFAGFKCSCFGMAR